MAKFRGLNTWKITRFESSPTLLMTGCGPILVYGHHPGHRKLPSISGKNRKFSDIHNGGPVDTGMDG